jgi:hypothetical protein
MFYKFLFVPVVPNATGISFIFHIKIPSCDLCICTHTHTCTHIPYKACSKETYLGLTLDKGVKAIKNSSRER